MSKLLVLFPLIQNVLDDEVESYGVTNSKALLSRYEKENEELYETGDPKGAVAALSSEVIGATILSALAIGKGFIELWQEWKKAFPSVSNESDTNLAEFINALEKHVGADPVLRKNRQADTLLSSVRTLLHSARGRALLRAFVQTAREKQM